MTPAPHLLSLRLHGTTALSANQCPLTNLVLLVQIVDGGFSGNGEVLQARVLHSEATRGKSN